MDNAGGTDGVSGNLNANWALSPHWSTRLSLLWNRVEPSTGSTGPVMTDRSIFVSLRAEEASGRPYMSQGSNVGGVGSGRIVGWDEQAVLLMNHGLAVACGVGCDQRAARRHPFKQRQR